MQSKYTDKKKRFFDLIKFKLCIRDSATFVPYIYGRLMLGDKVRSKKEIEILKDLYSLALRDLPQYDYIFFVPREFGYKKDGVRWQDEEVAQAVDKAILGFLDAENVKYSVIKGSTKEDVYKRQAFSWWTNDWCNREFK